MLYQLSYSRILPFKTAVCYRDLAKRDCKFKCLANISKSMPQVKKEQRWGHHAGSPYALSVK